MVLFRELKLIVIGKGFWLQTKSDEEKQQKEKGRNFCDLTMLFFVAVAIAIAIASHR